MKHAPPNLRANGDDALVAPPAVDDFRSTRQTKKWADEMTMLTPGMLKDRTTTNPTTTNRTGSAPQGALQRLRASLTTGRQATRTATDRVHTSLLHDVALGGTAASAANSFLKSLATGRRA